MFKLLICFCLIFLQQLNAAVLHLTEAEFDSHVDGSTNALVEFYAPWCGHCKNLAPEWEVVGNTFKPEDDVKIIAVDATESPDLAQKFDVKGYPTIKFFAKGEATTPDDYNGGREAADIVGWINNRVGTNKKVKTAPTAVTVLNKDNFDDFATSARFALVEFYAPWCGHCKQLAPTYEKLAKVFEGDQNVVVIGKVDATEETELAERYNIEGFPTLKFFEIDSSEAEDYEGDRSLEALVDLVNGEAVLHRDTEGGLKPEASIDKNWSQKIVSDGCEPFIQETTGRDDYVSGDRAETLGRYTKICEKILGKGAKYLTTELARVSKMIESDTVKPMKRTEFQHKKNILNDLISVWPSPDEL